jgi:hypothetical protein
MIVSNAKVPFGNRDTAVSTKTELDTGVTACRIRTDEFISMLNIIGNDKMSVSELMSLWHAPRATREHDCLVGIVVVVAPDE